MQTKSILKKLSILFGLLLLIFGTSTLARLLPDRGAGLSPNLPPLVRLHLPPQSADGITVVIDSYYADASRLVFKIRVEGNGQPYGIDLISLTNSKNEELNTGYGISSPANDPSTLLLEMIPAYALTDERLNGQLSFSVTPIDSSKSSRFHFDLDIPIHPAQTYLLSGGNLIYNEAAYNNPVYVDRLIVTLAFTWVYLCYAKPTAADWMIGRDATLTINYQTANIAAYNLLYDASMGDGTKGGEPGWKPIGNYPRCVKIGFPIGSEVSYPTKLALTIPTLEQSMPEVIPQETLNAAYPKLRAQGIDMEWHIMDGGAYPEYKKLATGMTEQEAYQKFIEALGYVHRGPWVFKIQLEPRESSQPVFSTSWYGTATPLPYPKSPGAATTEGRIRSFALRPDGNAIALATSHGIVVWDLDHKNVRVLNERENFFSVDWSPDGKSLAAGGLVMQDSEIGRPYLVVWDTSNWQIVFEPKLREDMTDTLYGDTAWSPDGRYLATANGYMGVTTFEVKTGRVVSEQDIFAGGSSDISWSPDSSRLIATGDMAYAIRRWKVDTDEWVRLFDPRVSFSLAAEWSPDGKRIASGHTGGAVCLWTAATNHCDGFIQAHQSAAFSLAWSPDGTRLATGGGVIRIWDSKTGQMVTSFGLSETSVYSKLTWPKPDFLISLETGYEEQEPTTVRFWDLTTGEILLEFQGDRGLLWQ